MAITTDQKKLDNLLSDLMPSKINLIKFKPEVVAQYEDHQKFLISGLTEDEEYKSRLAFSDAYKKELAQIHERLREAYGLEKGEHEFDYLNSQQFRDATGGKYSVVFDMMKDYLSYQYQMGAVSKETQDRVLADEPEAEREFRDRDRLKGNERNFLIDDDNPFSEEKREGLRECRKWMYRNCSKSGMLNETMTKRNYIDSFGKRSVAEQINTIFLMERRLYKFDEHKKDGSTEKIAMDNNYVPKLDNMKKCLVRGKINPYRHWKKATGDLFYWSRMERALKKTDAAANFVSEQYELFKTEEEKKKHISLQNQENQTEKRPTIASRHPNMARIMELYNVSIYDAFDVLRHEYVQHMKEFIESRSTDNFKKLQGCGVTLRHAYEALKDVAEFNEDPKRKAEIETFAAFSKNVDEHIRNMSNNEMEGLIRDKIVFAVEKTQLVQTVGSTGFSLSKAVSDMVQGTMDVLENGAEYLAFASCISCGVTAIKSFGQAITAENRKHKAEIVKGKNKEDLQKSREDVEKLKKEAAQTDPESEKGKEAQKKVEKAEEELKERQNINTMAKVSKSRNHNNGWMYFTAGTAASASFALGATGMLTTVGLPITIAAGAVAGIGFGCNYVAQQLAGKNPAKKSVDSHMKMEDKDYVPEKTENGKEHRYIDVKKQERLKIVSEKKGRFREGTENYNNTEYYEKNPDKLKDRIRTNYAVKNNCLTMLTFRDSKDKDNTSIAYRHIFLKDPDGPVTEDNLFSAKEMMKEYLSLKQEDLIKTGQTVEQVKKRLTYMDLLKSDGRKISLPTNMGDALSKMAPRTVQDKNADHKEVGDGWVGKEQLEKKLEEDQKERRALKYAKRDVVDFAKRSKSLLELLEKAGMGKDKEGYNKLHSALDKASQMNEGLSQQEIQKAMEDVNQAGSDYAKSHKGLFQGIFGSGKDRLQIAKSAEAMAAQSLGNLKNNTNGMDPNKSIDVLLRENEQRIRESAGALKQAEAEKAERQRKAREAAEKRAEKEQQKKAEKNVTQKMVK